MATKKPKSAMAALLDFNDSEPDSFDNEQQAHSISKTANSTFIESHNTLSTTEPNSNASSEERADSLVKVNPEECILWPFADRPSDEIGDIQSLAKSLKDHGQQEPILVRRNRQNTSHKYEIIFGNRRWRAAQLAKIPLIAICREISDQQASLCQKEENENRKELSDYARAMSYRAQIDGGIFNSETELSKVLGISRQTLNDLMAYLRVPEKLRAAISNYKMLPKNMVTKLASLSKDKGKLDVLIILAPKISEKKITAANVEKAIHAYLVPNASNNNNEAEKQQYEKRGETGNIVYQTKVQSNGSVSLQINRQILFNKNIEVLHERFSEFLDKFLNEES